MRPRKAGIAVRRGPVSATYRSRFTLIGSMNPEEGRLRPQIMDRFGLRVVVRGLVEADERLEAYRRVQAYLTNPRKTVAEYWTETSILRDEIQAARDVLSQVELPETVARLGLAIIHHLQIDSLRAEITLFEAARAYAAADNRLQVLPEDLYEVAPLAIRARRSQFMVEFFDNQQVEEGEIKGAMDQLFERKPTNTMISHRQRLEDCLAGKNVDRPPVALWRHFPVDDQTPLGLAQSITLFQRSFDFDLVKVTPASSYCLKDWGAQDEWRGNPEGTREYTRRVILDPEDWSQLPVLNPKRGYLGAELETLRLLVEELGPDTPVIHTIFNPLSQAKNLLGGAELLVHLRRYPEALQVGLKIITESTLRYIQALHETGIDGIFYAVQHAQYGLLTEQEYQLFGKPYDLQILEPAEAFLIKMLHLHGRDVMFDLLAEYPVNIINWHDRETDPSLSLGLSRFPGAVCGGVSQETLVYGTPDQIRSQALEAIQATGGQRVILGTGCVTPIIAPFGNILALRQAV